MTVPAPASALTTPLLARLLATGLSRPDGETLSRLVLLAAACEGGEELAAAVASADPAGLRDEFERLFGIDGACPSFEGAYEDDPFHETRQLADVAGFYAAFGAAAGGPTAERPDHVGCELEFAAFVALKAGQARDDGQPRLARRCEDALDGFLRDHLGRWFPVFCGDLEAATDDPVYTALARVGRRWIEEELAARSIEAAPVAGRRRGRLPVEDDELACGGEACPLARPSGPVPITFHGKALDR